MPLGGACRLRIGDIDEWCLVSALSRSSSGQKSRIRVGGTFGEHGRYLLQTRSVPMSNPKTEPNDNTKKDPDEWVSGDDPMTGAQASYLKTLCEQAGTPEAYDDNLTKAEASKMIDEMRQQAGVN
jgi:hypothetical protein